MSASARENASIAILGAGSWGTAVAIHLAHAGFKTYLWSHDRLHVKAMQRDRANEAFLPAIPLPEAIIPTDNLDDAVLCADLTLIAVPSHAFLDILNQMPKPKGGLAWLTKGLEPKTEAFLSDLVFDKWGPSFPVAVISGPSFAKEVAALLPTAITIASQDRAYQDTLRDILHQDNLRVYLTDDLIGVQICGAVKNVLAIACGISDGLGFGTNAKAALITRGLAEMTRLGVALGAKPETFTGLAGLGDLVLTCTDNQSRNRRYGLLIGQGKSSAEALKEIGQVVEGLHNTEQVNRLAVRHHVDMPICKEVLSILNGKSAPRAAVLHLMGRPPKGV